MTTQALDRTMTDDGRYYVLKQGTPQEERFRSVTAPLGRWDKDELKGWAAWLAARGAFDELTALIAATTIEDCGRTYSPACDIHGWDVQCPDCRCKKCEPCMVRWMRDRHFAESKRRMDEGSRFHELVDHWLRTGNWLTPDKDIEVYVESFKRWVELVGLKPDDYELLEARVINRTYHYAGTLDAAFWIFRDRSQEAADILDRLTKDGEPRLDRALILADYKTREKADRALYLEQPLQLAAYRFAETLVLPDGTELPLFAVDACAIVQVRPDQTSLELVLAEEPEFDAYLALHVADEWAIERGKTAIGARTFKFAPSVVKLRAADARKRRAEQKRREREAEITASANGSGAATEAPAAAAVPAPRPPADDDSPAARGARAAAAARRGVHPVLAEMAGGGPAPVAPFAEHVGRVTVTEDVLGRAMDGTLDDDSIPF